LEWGLGECGVAVNGGLSQLMRRFRRCPLFAIEPQVVAFRSANRSKGRWQRVKPMLLTHQRHWLCIAGH